MVGLVVEDRSSRIRGRLEDGYRSFGAHGVGKIVWDDIDHARDIFCIARHFAVMIRLKNFHSTQIPTHSRDLCNATSTMSWQDIIDF